MSTIVPEEVILLIYFIPPFVPITNTLSESIPENGTLLAVILLIITFPLPLISPDPALFNSTLVGPVVSFNAKKPLPEMSFPNFAAISLLLLNILTPFPLPLIITPVERISPEAVMWRNGWSMFEASTYEAV